MKGIRLHNIRVGDTRWVLQADTASVFREKKRVVAEVVEIDFFEEEEHVSKLTADQGILLQATDALAEQGNDIGRLLEAWTRGSLAGRKATGQSEGGGNLHGLCRTNAIYAAKLAHSRPGQ